MGFRRETLERALLRDAVVKATLMRATLHLVSGREYPLYHAAVRESVTSIRGRGVPPPSEDTVRRAIELAERSGRVTRRELLALLGHDAPLSRAIDPRPLRELHWLIALARLEQAPEAALWRPVRITPFRRLEVELPDALDARVHLVRRYLAAYGPATRADLATWSRVPLRDLDPALERLALRTLRDESGRTLLDLPRAPLAEADVAAPARFLPRWDSLLLAHDDRSRVMRPEIRAHVMAPNGDMPDTFLVDGFVAGSWSLEAGRVRLEPYDPLSRTARRELEDEARRLEAFLR